MLSKYPLVALMLRAMASCSMSGSLTMTIMYVEDVNSSMNAVNFWLRTTIDWNWKLVLMQLSLNCLMMLLIFSNRC